MIRVSVCAKRQEQRHEFRVDDHANQGEPQRKLPAMANGQEARCDQSDHWHERIADPGGVYQKENGIKEREFPHRLNGKGVDTFAVPQAFGLLHHAVRVLPDDNEHNNGAGVIKRWERKYWADMAATLDENCEREADSKE